MMWNSRGSHVIVLHYTKITLTKIAMYFQTKFMVVLKWCQFRS